MVIIHCKHTLDHNYYTAHNSNIIVCKNYRNYINFDKFPLPQILRRKLLTNAQYKTFLINAHHHFLRILHDKLRIHYLDTKSHMNFDEENFDKINYLQLNFSPSKFYASNNFTEH